MTHLHLVESPPAMDLALRPLRIEGLEWCTYDDGGLITDMEANRTWALNPVGLFIWDHCDGSRDIGQIEDAMSFSFGVDSSTAHRDLEGFLLDMETQGLLQLSYPVAS